MDILGSFISVFLTCYFIYWIVSLFRSSKGPKIAFILITIDVVIHLVWPIISMSQISDYITQLRLAGEEVSSDTEMEIYLYYIGEILSTLVAYLLFVYLFFLRNMHFKSIRSREFERIANGKGKGLIIASQIIFIIVGLVLIGFGSYLAARPHSVKMKLGAIFMIIIGALILIVDIISFVKRRNVVASPDKKIEKVSNFYLLISTPYEDYLYESQNGESFKEALNGFDDIYIVNERGTIKGSGFKNMMYLVCGTYISDDDILNLKMNRIYNDKLVEIIKGTSSIHKQNITVDEDFNIINIKED